MGQSPFLQCATCGDRIGVYEPIWPEFGDGTLHRSSYLNLDAYPAHDPSRLWHLDCLSPQGAVLRSDPMSRHSGDEAPRALPV